MVGESKPPPVDDVSRVKVEPPELLQPRQHETDSTSPQRTLTSSVTEDWTDDYIHGDPLKEHLAKHFCHGTDMVDPLVAQVSTLEDKSCTSKADPSTIPSAFSNMLWDCDATANRYNKERVLTA